VQLQQPEVQLPAQLRQGVQLRRVISRADYEKRNEKKNNHTLEENPMGYKNMVDLGHTFYEGMTVPSSYGQSVDMEGMPTKFSAKRLVSTLPGSAPVFGFLMRNTSAITIPGGFAVRAATGYYRRRFDGMTNVTGMPVVGIVDPLLGTTGVRAGDICNVLVKGKCLVWNPLTLADFPADWAEHDILYSASGTSNGNSVGATTTNSGGHLMAISSIGTANNTQMGSVVYAYVNRVGRVLSSCISSYGMVTTAMSKLVELELSW
jgi:hypothetical protein